MGKANFAKVFSSITESTIWLAPDPHRIVWITMLLMGDQYGRVMASVPGLAHRANVSVRDAREAIQSFLSPDADSRTPDHEGRRLEVIDGGWRLLNSDKYRDLKFHEDRQEQNRLAQQRRREKLRKQAGK